MLSELQPRRSLLLLRACAVLALACLASPATAQLRDPLAWEVLVPRQSLVAAVEWDGRLAGADAEGGLLLLDPADDTVSVMTTRDGFTSNRLRCLAVGDDGSLWVGTADAGLLRLVPGARPRAITGVIDPQITAVATDGDFLYYGTPVGGGRVVNGLPELSFTEEFGLVSEDIRALAARDGRVWFGTDAGVSEFDRQTSAFVTRNDGLGGDLVIYDLLASDVDVFAATDGGVYRLRSDGVWEKWGNGLDVRVDALVAHAGGLAALRPGDQAALLAAAATDWTSLVLPDADYNFDDLVSVNGELWFAGQVLDPTRIGNDPLATFWRSGQLAPATVRGLFGTEARGVAIDHDGGAWFGTQPVFFGLTHWRADGSVVAYAIEDTDPTDPIDFGLLRNLKIAVLESRAGEVWVSGLGRGVTRIQPSADDDPALAAYLHFNDFGEGLLDSRRVVRIAEDPAGRIWFGSDGENVNAGVNAGIDILAVPADPRNPSSWVKVTSTNSLLAADGVFGIDFEDAQTVWLSVKGAGLQRWVFDPEGDGIAADDAALNDVFAWRTIARLPENALGNAILEPRGVAFAEDGRVWVATLGEGLFRFPIPGSAPLLTAEVERLRESAFGLSLLSSQVRSIAFDGNGDLWAATDAGLNRVTERSGELDIDAWTDFVAFDTRDLGQLYLPDILSPLPGSNMRAIAFDATSGQLYMGTQLGAARLRVDRLLPIPSEELSVVLYPNPVRGNPAQFFLEDIEGQVDVEVYNLLGVLLHTARDIRAGEPVWDLRDLTDAPVASGMYVVRVIRDDQTVLRTLAVER